MANQTATWPKVVLEIFTILVAAVMSIVVLLIFANDRLDGDEVWKGALVGPATVGAYQFFRSDYAQAIFAKFLGRWVKPS